MYVCRVREREKNHRFYFASDFLFTRKANIVPYFYRFSSQDQLENSF